MTHGYETTPFPKVLAVDPLSLEMLTNLGKSRPPPPRPEASVRPQGSNRANVSCE